MPRDPDQIGGGEFRARALVEIVVEHVEAFFAELAVKPLAGGVGVGAALLEIEDDDFEGRDRLRPLDPSLVMERLDDGGD